MSTPSCRSPRRSHRLRPTHKTAHPPVRKGQALVIFAVALLALVVFIGLAIDAGSVYVSYGQLKRAVDAAAVAAANDFKRGTEGMTMADRLALMTAAADEVLDLHNVDMTTVDLVVVVCDSDGDGIRDADLQTNYPNFYGHCPNTQANESPRKLVYVEAHQRAPLYFLSILGFDRVNLNVNTIAEAAPVDLVIVLDISESMASDTVNTLRATYPNIVDNYDPDSNGTPAGCNTDNSCHPLWEAKDAAKALVNTLYQGYDQVAVVTFDSIGMTHAITNLAGNNVDLSDDLSSVNNVIDSIGLHDDAPYAKMWPYWKGSRIGGIPLFNPLNPEDRDGDGGDADPNLPPCYINPFHPLCCALDGDRWDENPKFNYLGWGGFPCDDDFKTDAYDWNGDGTYTEDDNTAGLAYIAKVTRDPDGGGPLNAFGVDSPLSTCTGCGMRTAANVLRRSGRPGAVWVIIFLSDGMANLSDTPNTSSIVPSDYKNGFCNGTLGTGFWRSICLDLNAWPRYCIDTDQNTCPIIPPPPDPNEVLWSGNDPDLNYSVLDYARDMTDEAALTRSINASEPPGNDIAIYAIGLGGAVGAGTAGIIGEDLLRYMGAVGDDGDRTTDGCRNVAHRVSCGNYYYAPSGESLLPIFEDIATRIYTRVSE